MDACVRYTPAAMIIALIGCCAGAFLMPLLSTMMNLALPSIDAEFDVGSKALALVNITFLIASVITIVPVARLSDIYGRKRIFVIGIIMTVISGVIAFFTPSYEILLAMRVIMGSGSAAITVSSIALLTEVYPFARRGWAIGMQSTFVYLGIAIGPTLGGFICEFMPWRNLFLFIMPFAAVALIFMLKFKEEPVQDTKRRMDYKGSLVYGVSISLTMFGAVNLPNVWAICMIAVGLMILVVFVMMMRRSEQPILDVRVFRFKVFTRACVAAFMNYGASYSVAFFLALYLQHLGELSPLRAGAILFIQPAIQAALSALSGSYSDRIADKRILPTVGMMLIAVGVFMIIFLQLQPNFYYVAVILVLLGLGYALFAAPNTNAVMSSVPPKNRGEASGMISFVRQVGMLTSMGVATCAIAMIMGSKDSLFDPANWPLFIEVIKIAFTICFGMCVVGIITSWFRGKDQRDPDECP
ncbi:MAG: MFS transporter [Methanomassiliicoccaceae archaeon]|nr:MFS transporter [Methanomassiliicoccaceae archaeon]